MYRSADMGKKIDDLVAHAVEAAVERRRVLDSVRGIGARARDRWFSGFICGFVFALAVMVATVMVLRLKNEERIFVKETRVKETRVKDKVEQIVFECPMGEHWCPFCEGCHSS